MPKKPNYLKSGRICPALVVVCYSTKECSLCEKSKVKVDKELCKQCPIEGFCIDESVCPNIQKGKK